MLEVLLQDKWVQPSPGGIFLAVKVWYVFKETINKVMVSEFGYLIVVKFQLKFLYVDFFCPTRPQPFS